MLLGHRSRGTTTIRLLRFDSAASAAGPAHLGAAGQPDRAPAGAARGIVSGTCSTTSHWRPPPRRAASVFDSYAADEGRRRVDDVDDRTVRAA